MNSWASGISLVIPIVPFYPLSDGPSSQNSAGSLCPCFVTLFDFASDLLISSTAYCQITISTIFTTVTVPSSYLRTPPFYTLGRRHAPVLNWSHHYTVARPQIHGPRVMNHTKTNRVGISKVRLVEHKRYPPSFAFAPPLLHMGRSRIQM